MDFSIPEEYLAIAKMVRKFVEDELYPIERAVDERDTNAFLEMRGELMRLDYAKKQGAVIQYLGDDYIEIRLITGGEYFATSTALKGWDPGRLTNFVDYVTACPKGNRG